MQKVVGSNPISRFEVNPLHVDGFGVRRRNKINHPISHVASYGLILSSGSG
jgi:hypothetical protein